METITEDKIDFVIEVCHKLADILKDPTHGGTRELTAEARTTAREEAHDELLACLDVLAACVQYHQGFSDVISIARKYKVNSIESASVDTVANVIKQ